MDKNKNVPPIRRKLIDNTFRRLQKAEKWIDRMGVITFIVETALFTGAIFAGDDMAKRLIIIALCIAICEIPVFVITDKKATKLTEWLTKYGGENNG